MTGDLYYMRTPADMDEIRRRDRIASALALAASGHPLSEGVRKSAADLGVRLILPAGESKRYRDLPLMATHGTWVELAVR